jgi:hypothetical protein
VSSGGEGEWPTLDELKKVLNVTSDDWDHQLGRTLDAGIAQVKSDVGDWDEEVDEPDDALATAALVKAEMASNTTTAREVLQGRYDLLMKGHRRRFGIG